MLQILSINFKRNFLFWLYIKIIWGNSEKNNHAQVSLNRDSDLIGLRERRSLGCNPGDSKQPGLRNTALVRAEHLRHDWPLESSGELYKLLILDPTPSNSDVIGLGCWVDTKISKDSQRILRCKVKKCCLQKRTDLGSEHLGFESLLCLFLVMRL